MSPYTRRKLLITQMKEAQAQGFSCAGCAGTCCTYEANSMMVTPIEAIELHQYLKSAQLLNQELKTKCEETVSKYRLDQALGNGRRTLIRRTYTCPFFGHQELGCPLPREVKPYGCLAFNAHDQEKKGGEFCFSDVKLLEEREKLMGTEDLLNQELKEKFKLHWDKLPLPLALLELWDADTEILFAD